MQERVMVVVAAGYSTRFGSEKLISEVAGMPLIAHTVLALTGLVDRCIVVVREDHLGVIESLDLPAEVVPGGATRTESEGKGLALAANARLIGIHDGARPGVSESLVNRLFEAAQLSGGAVPVLEAPTPLISRDELLPLPKTVRVQTPQVFWGPELIGAYRVAARVGFAGHDTADVVRQFTNIEISAVPGDPDNIKITYPEDLARFEATLKRS